MRPTAASEKPGDSSWKLPAFSLDTETLTKIHPGDQPAGPVIEVIPAASVRPTADGPKLSRDCPFCLARDSLTIIGFQAATLTSVTIDQLFASPFNDDKKLLTFSDSVQDAAHRAGFFGARTWRTNLRIAMLRVIREREGLTLAELADALGARWKKRMDVPTWVSTFLAPNMAWLDDWGSLGSDGKLPADSDLEALIDRRLGYEVDVEFGLQAGIGRSLTRTGTATVALDPARLERAVGALVEPLRNEVPGLREVSSEAVRHFVVGLLHFLRTRGGILARSLPDEYVESSGRDVHAFKRTRALPVYGRTSRLPAFLTDRSRSVRFETWGGKSWYSRWVGHCFGAGQTLTADSASTYPVVLPVLVSAGLLSERTGKKGEGIWGLDESALVVTSQVAAVACDRCGNRTHVAARERDLWLGLPCLTARCQGNYAVDPMPAQDYFGRLYAGGHLQRIFTEEHTGLLDRGERERVEREFKARPGPPDDPEARKPWFANLLSCSPTLEMGIDARPGQLPPAHRPGREAGRQRPGARPNVGLAPANPGRRSCPVGRPLTAEHACSASDTDHRRGV